MAGLVYYSISSTISAGGSDINLTVPFPYLRDIDVFVYRDGVELFKGQDWDFLTPTQVTIHGATAPGAKMVVRRITRKDERLAQYWNGSTLTEDDLNIVTKQLLFCIQEMYDYLSAHDAGQAPPGGPGNNDGDGTGDIGDLIDQIIQELLNSQLFQDLIALIPLVDINAELVLGGIMDDLDRWSEGRVFGDLIHGLDQGLSEIDTRVTHQIQELIDGQSATVTQLDALQARYEGTAADLIHFEEVQATANSALAADISTLSVRIDGNESRIGTIEQVKIDANEADALIQQEISQVFSPGGLFDQHVNTNSYINGISAVATKDAAGIASLTQFISGTNVTVNPDGSITFPSTPNGGLASSLAAVSNTVGTLATHDAATSQMKSALVSKFLPALNPNDPDANWSPLVAAMQQTWQTYADSQSATASAVQTLQVNRQPIFFRTDAPNPYAAEFGTTYYTSNGFPAGSLWYRQSGSQLYPYYWAVTTSLPAGSTTGFGPYTNPRDGAVHAGMWVDYRDPVIADVVGASINSLSSVYMTPDQVQATVETYLETVFNKPTMSAVQTIGQRMTSLLNPGTGTMYSNWTVRINSYLGSNTPVIAGVGLGMQTDPNNPKANSRSQFIIMADQIGIIKPPEVDPLGGPLDLSTVVVPFVVDTSTGTVGINGKLLVKGSLGAYDGAVGRLIATQLNPDATISVKDASGNAIGPRCGLFSSFHDFNASNMASPFDGGSNPQRFWIWAGEGVMNHNNASFYVDTDGNAYYAGIVSADNVDGTFNDSLLINSTFSDTPCTSTSPTTLPPVFSLASSAGRNRFVYATVSVQIHRYGGDGDKVSVGNLYMEMDHETAPGVWANAWTQVASTLIYVYDNVTVNLQGCYPSQTNGKVRMRLKCARAPGFGSDYNSPNINSITGMMVGLR